MAANSSSVEMSPGVLASKQVQQLFEQEAITSYLSEPPEIEGSAFNLRLGTTAWHLTEGQRPTTRELGKLKAKSSRLRVEFDSDGEYFLFKRKNIYLVELDGRLNLPGNINGRATGRSSIGRLDVITRLITDNSSEYDIVEQGYGGPLHLLIQPQTFSIKVGPGASLNQLRLFSGPPHASVITRSLIPTFGTPFWYVSHPTRPSEFYSWEELTKEYGESMTADPFLFDLTVDLADPEYGYIYKAINKSPEPEPIDLRKGVKSHDPTQYFEKVPIEIDGATRSVVLEQDSFYIMKSKERLFIPRDVAVEVVAISERIGDIRIHYAGFAHPGFGRHNNPRKSGTPLIFEVRATDMPTRLYDRSLLARIQLFRMSAETEVKSSEYDQQELKLSGVFKDWPK
jgi:dCTP deaminase